jgi:DNA (cytosine-5)-methyltransferase 1
MENVKQLVGEKFLNQFNEWKSFLWSLGYKNFVQVLNAKEHGVPQNRERVFMVSVLGECDGYSFPMAEPLKKTLADVLEEEVDEKYFLSEKLLNWVISHSEKKIAEGNSFKTNFHDREDSHCGAIVSTYQKCAVTNPFIKIAGTLDIPGMNEHESRVYDPEGIAHTIHAMKGGNKPKVQIGAIRGRNIENPTSRETGIDLVQTLEINQNGVSNTLTTVQKDNVVVRDFKIRRLIPLECWRLMGFSDEAFNKAREVNSDTQLYKQAGNSIVVNVLEGIFRNLFQEPEDGTAMQMNLF